MHKTVIGTWLHAETKETESLYPQVGGASSSTAFQEIYWRCVVLFFASSIRHNPEASHKLFTTVSNVPDIGSFSISAFLESHKVEVIQVPFTYLPPPGFYGSWRNQFYILDILKYLDKHGLVEDQYIILDSDCVFTAPIHELSQDLSLKGLLALDLDLPVDQDINGITQRDMKQIFEDLGQPCSSESVKYYGGEFFAATVEVIHYLAHEIDPLWEFGLNRFQEGKLKFNEEAHFLSYLYARHGFAKATANPYIARLWTGLKFRNTSPKDFDLMIWHVPAEKKHGIKRLFQQVIRPESRFWTVAPGQEFARYVAGYLGIPKSSPLKKSRDAFDTVIWRIAGKLTQSKKSLVS